jgi:hypothetical protein
VVVHTCNTSTEEVEVGEQASKNCLDRQTERKKERKREKEKEKKNPKPLPFQITYLDYQCDNEIMGAWQ